jgi:hypothetical protein
MASFRSSKVSQLGGVGMLGAYLLVQAWWLTSMAPDDTSDDAFLVLLVGAPIAFVIGWFGVPFVIDRLKPSRSRHPRAQARRRRSGSDPTTRG